MMNHKRFFAVTLLLLVGSVQTLFSQKTSVHDEPEAVFRMALELFNKEKYGAAKPLFLETFNAIDNPTDEIRGSALFYAGACAAELFNPEAETYLLGFINKFPTHPAQQTARFYMGNLNYRNRNYKEAANWYSSSSFNQLTAAQRSEYHFKKGYSHFMADDYGPALQALAQVKDPGSAFYAPANYYYGHISYLQGRYDVALSRFRLLENDHNFGPVIPYYITHIFYLQERYDDLLAYAPALLQEATPRRAPEIAKLIGDANFKKGQYHDALPYLARYIGEPGNRATREDHYQLGYAYFITNDYASAIRHLEVATKESDELAQNAWYHLAAAYLQTNQKRFARNAFQQAFQMNLPGDIARESLFNYAKLSFELSLDPYNEAILAFKKYIQDYPDSDLTPQAQSYLIDLYLTTSNYKEALESLETMNINTPRLREAYQRIAYYRGVDLFNNGNFSDAIAHFKKSRRFTDNRSIAALSLFWEGEAYYRTDQFRESVTAHEAFLVSPGAFIQNLYNRANYSIGYAHFKLKNYPQAIAAFRKFISDRNEDSRLLNDASLRIADSYFVSKNYQAALDFYDRAIGIGVLDNDYAVYQKALVYGIMGQFQNKITTLQQFLNRYASSMYASDAKYEMGNTWLILNNQQNALTYFNQVINQHPNSTHVKNSMLKTGLIHFNNNEDERALQLFKQVVSRYPGSPESMEALRSIRNIYVSLNRVDDYFRYSENISFANVTNAQQDSLTYIAAENRYMQGDCSNAIQGFNSYIQRFPNGIFSLNAHYYLADCEFRRSSFDQALSAYRFVIDRPRSTFTENALLRASQIEFSRGNYEQALPFFRQLEEIADGRANILEGRTGQMRCLHRLRRFEQASLAARKVMETDWSTPEHRQEAQLIMGIAAMELQDPEKATGHLKVAADAANNIFAAEAMYLIALIEFRKGNYEGSEALIFNYMNRLSAHDYWLARAFLLLADNYIEMGNTFQARHTLQSIIENYQGDDIRTEARQKISFVDRIEKEMQGEDQDDTLEIDFNQNRPR